MWVGGVARHIADNTELAVWRSERSLVYERRNLGREVDAVDEDIGLDDFLVGARLGLGLWEIPFLERILASNFERYTPDSIPGCLQDRP